MLESSRTTADLLRQTKPWVRFLSVLGFITCGLMLVLGILMGIGGLATGNTEMLLGFAFYPLFSVLYIFPSLFLFRYASHIADFLRDGQPDQLNAALEAQKSFWKFIGILTIVMLGLYAVLLGIVVLAAMAGAL